PDTPTTYISPLSLHDALPIFGINANKNWLPHHTEGTPDQGGDQFATATARARLEHSWMGAAKRWLKDRPGMSRLFVPVKKAGRLDRKSTRLNSSHRTISYAVF